MDGKVVRETDTKDTKVCMEYINNEIWVTRKLVGYVRSRMSQWKGTQSEMEEEGVIKVDTKERKVRMGKAMEEG